MLTILLYGVQVFQEIIREVPVPSNPVEIPPPPISESFSERPVERPVERPAERPVERPVERPARRDPRRNREPSSIRVAGGYKVYDGEYGAPNNDLFLGNLSRGSASRPLYSSNE